MLTTLRNSSKNAILKFVLGTLLTVLIISFAMWGTEDLVGITKKQNTVASVGKLDVSAQEFYSLYSRPFFIRIYWCSQIDNFLLPFYLSEISL